MNYSLLPLMSQQAALLPRLCNPAKIPTATRAAVNLFYLCAIGAGSGRVNNFLQKNTQICRNLRAGANSQNRTSEPRFFQDLQDYRDYSQQRNPGNLINLNKIPVQITEITVQTYPDDSGGSLHSVQTHADNVGSSLHSVQTRADDSGGSLHSVQTRADDSGSSLHSMQTRADDSGSSLHSVKHVPTAAAAVCTRNKPLLPENFRSSPYGKTVAYI